MGVNIALIITTCIITATPLRVLDEVNETRFLQDAIVQQLFEMARKLIITGDPEKDVPVMDPRQYGYSEKRFDGRIFRMDANFTNSSLTGLANFELLKTDFDKKDVSIDLDIVFPSLLFESDHYKMDGDIFGVIPLAGEGKIHVELFDLRFCGKVLLKQSADGKSILLDTFENAHFSIKEVSSHTDFDGNIDEIFNAMIKDLLPFNLNRFDSFLISLLSDKFIESFNPILNLYETWRLIVVILH